MSLPYDPKAPPLMVCGHYANATGHTIDGPVPACAIHGETRIDTNPDHGNTEWYCPSCKRTSDKPDAFADLSTGTHYDGCRGWN